MARSRNIKPGFYKNEDLAECSIWARFIFPGLWMLADRDGRLEDRPKRIKAELLAFDSQDVDPLLDELQARGFLMRYRNSDGAFIQISKFAAHQTPHYSEKPSVIKPPNSESNPGNSDNEGGGTPGGLQEDFANPLGLKGGAQPPDSLIPDSLIPESGKPPTAPPRISPGPTAWLNLSFERLTQWREAYPAVDLPAELHRALAWVHANPQNRKSNYERFLTNWLARAQERAPARPNTTPRRTIHDERAATIAAATGADRQRPAERDITPDSAVVG